MPQDLANRRRTDWLDILWLFIQVGAVIALAAWFIALSGDV